MTRPSSMAAAIVSNRSSCRTMDAASLATSVPRSPMATPTSDFLSAGASLTPSPSMATISPRAWSASITVSLSCGATRLNAPTWGHAPDSSSACQLRQLAPVDHLIVRGQQTELTTDRLGGQPLIAGHHDGAQPGLTQLAMVALTPGAGGSLRAHEADKCQPARATIRSGCVDRTGGQREHTAAPAAPSCIDGDQPPDDAGSRRPRRSRHRTVAQLQQATRRPLDVRDRPARPLSGTSPEFTLARERNRRRQEVALRCSVAAGRCRTAPKPAVIARRQDRAPRRTCSRRRAACGRLASAATRRTRSKSRMAHQLQIAIGSIVNSLSVVQMRTTDMSPDVSVRVLSVQMTVVEPRASTDGRRRTSACRFAIR